MHIPDKTRLREFLRIKKYLVLALVGKPDRKKEHVKNRCSVENQTCEGRKEKKIANVGRKEKNCKRGRGMWGGGVRLVDVRTMYSRTERRTAGWLGYGILFYTQGRD